MAQYKTGSVSVTNGSAVVTGTGTLWVGEVAVGDIFTIVGSNAWYEVGSVNSNTQITLTANYAGATITDSTYAISRDFTSNKNIPYPQKGDIETASLIKRAMSIIDTELSTGFDSSNVTITGGTIDNTQLSFTSAGTANGVTYLNGSKVLTSGSGLTFDGTNFASTGIITSTNANGLRAQYPSSASYYGQLDARDGNTYLSAVGSTAAIVFSATDGPGTTAEAMRLTSTGLGIKTSIPAYPLDVNGYGRLQGGLIGSSGLTMYGDSSSATGAFLSTAGNLGIGTSSPGTYSVAPNLVVASATSGGMTIRSGINEYGGVFFADGTTGDEQYRGFIQYNHNYVGSVDSLLFGTAGSTRATLDSSGNLGLGVAPSGWGSSSRAIDIAGFSSVAQTSSGSLANSFNAYLNSAGNWIYKTTNAASQYQVGLAGTAAHAWYTAPSGTAGNAISFTQAMTLDASGNLLVGRTDVITFSANSADGVVARPNRLDVSSASVARITQIRDSTGVLDRFYNGATVVGNITCTTSSTSYGTSSDYRLKEDWQPMTGASERVKALKPVNFAWKADGSRVDGFLAHEAQAVVPEAVTGEKDAVELVDIKNEDGNVTGQEERPVYQGIDQSKLVPLLTAALQEALAKIESLEARLDAANL